MKLTRRLFNVLTIVQSLQKFSGCNNLQGKHCDSQSLFAGRTLLKSGGERQTSGINYDAQNPSTMSIDADSLYP